MLGEVLDEMIIIGPTGCDTGRGIEPLGKLFMSPIGLGHATSSPALGGRAGLNPPGLYDG